MKTTTFKIVLIGSGNVASHLGQALKDAGHTILQVYSKRKSASEILAKQLKTDSTNLPSKINLSAELYIIAVTDDAIEEVIRKVKWENQLLVHTSGSKDISIFKGLTNNYGVFYPLQTFTKGKSVDFKTIPICLEASNAKSMKTLQALAKSISNNVQKLNSEQRTHLHLAAVFACNFSNHLYGISSKILSAKGLSLDLIKPLIEETAEKIQQHDPAKMQTGPAIRGDKKTMEKHLKLIESKEYKKIYQLLSKSIQDK